MSGISTPRNWRTAVRRLCLWRFVRPGGHGVFLLFGGDGRVGVGPYIFTACKLLSFAISQQLFILLSATCFLATAQPGATQELKTSGYLKNFFTALNPPSPGGGSLEGVGSSRLRLRLLWKKRAFTAEVAYELAPRVQGEVPGSELPRPAPLSYRAFDLRTWLYPARGSPAGSFAMRHNLDRGILAFSTSWADFSMGRQALAFGSARVLNPTDVFAPFTFEELDKEEWVGVDALRIRLPTGDLSEVDVGVVFGDEFKGHESAAFLRGRFYVRKTDLTPVVVLFKENLLLGLDVTRALGGAGYWFEAGYTFAGVATNYCKEENYVRLSTGLDYSFGRRLYGFVEYHLNGAGTGRTAAYLSRLGYRAYAEGAVYLLGRHYAAPGFTFQLTPLVILSAQTLVNMSDGSAFVSPRLEYSFSDNVFVEVGGFAGLGTGTKIAVGLVPFTPRSEFGLYPDTYFASVRLYF